MRQLHGVSFRIKARIRITAWVRAEISVAAKGIRVYEESNHLG